MKRCSALVSPGIGSSVPCQYDALWPGPYCYYHHKQYVPPPIAELNGHRSLVDALESWTSAEELLAAWEARDSLEHERYARGVRWLAEVGDGEERLGL